MKTTKLIEMAVDARRYAYTPTKYYVGAAILTKAGNVYTGCNFGTTDGLFNICAEQVAIYKLISEGREKIDKIAIVGGYDGQLVQTTPCGACRQLIMELASDAKIVCASGEEGKMEFQTYTPQELMPYGYVMD